MKVNPSKATNTNERTLLRIQGPLLPKFTRLSSEITQSKSPLKMSSLLASLKERLLGTSGPRTNPDQLPCVPPPPEPPPDLCNTAKRRPLRISNPDGTEEEDISPVAINKGPAAFSLSEDCAELLEDLGGSLTPSTPGSSDALGISFLKLHHMAECANCCELPLPMLDDVPSLPPAKFDPDDCKRIIAKYCPNFENPSRKSLEALKKKLLAKVRSMKRDLQQVSGSANKAKMDEANAKPLPSLEFLFNAVERGKRGVLGKQPAVRCDYPAGAELEGIRGLIEAKQTQLKGISKKVRKLKQFQKSLAKLNNGQDVRGNFMLLEAEASAEAARLGQYREIFAMMISAKMEWEMYFAQMLSALSNHGDVPKLHAEMDRYAEDPPTFSKILWSLLTAAMALDENDIHFYQDDTDPLATRECPEPCSIEKADSRDDVPGSREAAGVSCPTKRMERFNEPFRSSTSEAHCTDASETSDDFGAFRSAWRTYEPQARKAGGQEGDSEDKCLCPEPTDTTPLVALKNLLLVTRSNVDEVADDLRKLECSVNTWTHGLLGILDGLD